MRYSPEVRNYRFPLIDELLHYDYKMLINNILNSKNN